MKTLAFIFLLSFSYSVHAQKSIFVRVYNFAGKKINKGYAIMVTDTSLQLKGNPEPVDIPVRNISFIKTKHSIGNNALVGSLIAASTFAIIGAATASSSSGSIIEFDAGTSAAGGFIVGLPVGAVIGLVTGLSKNSKSIKIEGDIKKLKAFQSVLVENN